MTEKECIVCSDEDDRWRHDRRKKTRRKKEVELEKLRAKQQG